MLFLQKTPNTNNKNPSKQTKQKSKQNHNQIKKNPKKPKQIKKALPYPANTITNSSVKELRISNFDILHSIRWKAKKGKQT